MYDKLSNDELIETLRAAAVAQTHTTEMLMIEAAQRIDFLVGTMRLVAGRMERLENSFTKYYKLDNHN